MSAHDVPWAEVLGHLTGLAHLATADPSGRPAVAIVSCVADDDVLWAQTRRSSRKAANLAANPEAALMWQAGSEAYVWTRGEVSDDVATKQALWSRWAYDASSFFGSPDDPGVVLLRFTPVRASVMTAVDGAPARLVWRA